MSINLTYRRFTPADFARATASEKAWVATYQPPFPGLDLAQLQAMAKNPTPDAMEKFMAALQAQASDPMQVDLNKGWHLFAYLLTGEHEIHEGHRTGAPLHNVLFGGTPTTVQTGYGPVRSLSGPLLHEVATAFAGLSQEAFLARWDLEEMRAKDIYACPEDDEEQEMVLEIFERLKTLLSEADAAGEVVAIYGH